MRISSKSFLHVLLLGSAVAWGAEIEVQPGRSALQDAIKRAAEGDTLVVHPGVYLEHVQIDKRIVVRGLPGAVMEGAEDFRAECAVVDLEVAVTLDYLQSPSKTKGAQ